MRKRYPHLCQIGGVLNNLAVVAEQADELPLAKSRLEQAIAVQQMVIEMSLQQEVISDA